MEKLTREQREAALAYLNLLIDSRRLTQTQLAQLTGLSQSHISRVTHKHQDVTDEVLERLFEALGIRLADIYPWSNATEKISIYVATPLTGVVEDPRAEKNLLEVVAAIQEAASSQEFEDRPFSIYWPGNHTHPVKNAEFSPEQVYKTDRARASSFNGVIFFCAAPSYGVGQENEIATQAGVPSIRLLPEKISRMITGSFLKSLDIRYTGDLKTSIEFNKSELVEGLRFIRKTYFRHRVLHKNLSGSGFGIRLRNLINKRQGDYETFADELGIALSYLHTMMDEPFAVSNPSGQLLRRLANLLSVSVGYLFGEAPEVDTDVAESRASWRKWVETTPALDSKLVVGIFDDWLEELGMSRAEKVDSSRDPVIRKMKVRIGTNATVVARGTPMAFFDRSLSRLVELFVGRSASQGSPEVVMENHVLRLRNSVKAGPCILDFYPYLKMRNIQTTLPQIENGKDGQIRPRGSSYAEGFTAYVNTRVSSARARFTLAHEICHTFFYEVVPEIKFQPHQTDAMEEYLCNVGAAALLIPSDDLRNEASKGRVSIQTLYELASIYRVSIEAMFLRLRYLNLWNCEAAIWREMMDGTFMPKKMYSQFKGDWVWANQDIPLAAISGERVSGYNFLLRQDDDGKPEARRVYYEAERYGNVVFAILSDRPPKRKMPSKQITLFAKNASAIPLTTGR